MIGKKIKDARLELGLTQKELAHRLGTTPQNLAQYETGKRSPKFETLEKIAKALNTTGYELLGFSDREYQLYKAHEGAELDEKENPLVIGGILVSEKNLIRQYNALNNSGKAEAIRRVSELKYIPDYVGKEDTPFD